MMICREDYMAHGAFVARRLSFTVLSCFVSIAAIDWHGEPHPAAPKYTIAFKSFAPNNTDIFVADGNGGHARPLLPSTALDYDASFSADGKWVVFTSHRSGTAKIYRVHPDGSGLEA